MAPTGSTSTRVRDLGSLLAAAAVVGVLAAAGATIFTSVLHAAENLLWTTVPAAMGASEPPAWWVLLLLALGGAGTWAAARLPGHGGHHPLDGLAFDVPPRVLPSALLAAFASLAFGAVLGPEAPLLAIGASVGVVAFRRARDERAKVLVVAGAAAALGLVLGNPLVTALLVLEGALLRSRAARTSAVGMLPVLVALGAGYLLRVGVDDWPGVHVGELAVGGLTPYPAVRVIDLLVGVGVGLVVAVLIAVVMRGAGRLRTLVSRAPLVGLVGAGLAVGAAALAVRSTTGADVGTVLFSGQSALDDVTALSGGTLLAVALAKSLAYALSLGAGFRGGTIFPAVFIGVAVGAATSGLVPGSALSPLVACGIAAGVAAVLGMPLTAVMLGLLLTAPAAGPAVTVVAVVGAVVGLVVKLAADARRQGVLPDTTDHDPVNKG
ncbi:chloride channel protein [Oerskovia flava]|uniref:chloride channel protein n=1 Tax=Oerskovia flava TaxID=2986422 RepID=UPI00223EB0D3|nr:chloride channel protein [Oerskovia sp. JB1-3-2]